MKITIYNEYHHESTDEKIRAIYPNGIHGAISSFLKDNFDCDVMVYTVENVNTELTDEVLADTDVLLWWGHMAHEKVNDDVALRVKEHVLSGMGAIFLHSAHMSKPFHALMGTSGALSWKDGFVKERLWCVSPGHPIAKDIPTSFVLEKEELYAEPFDIPTPDDLVFMAWYDNGYVFRSGCTYTRGNGKVFYFQPGHEEFPIYFDKTIQKIITNAVEWAVPSCRAGKKECIQLSDNLN